VALITIPENFEVLPDGLAPICVEDHDAGGRPINLQWIDRGVRPIHKDLCNLITVLIGDVWAVSEIVNRSVHGLSRKYGDNLGAEPQARVYTRAQWEAKDEAAGGRRLRQRLDQSLDELDSELQNARLIDSRDSAQSRDARLDIDALASNDELRLIIGLHLDGWTWREIGEHLHRKANTVEQKFLRWTRRLRRMSSTPRPRIRDIY
jgi:DNA-directed RNA polymerase specialized sigma24 family protein